MLDEFKKFIFKGNVVDLSTGVIIGAAFGDIVKAFTDGIVKPLINKLGGGTAEVKYFLFGVFDVGTLISAVFNFLIVAAVVFFLIVKPMNHAMTIMKSKEAAAPPPGPTPTEALLTEIRDALKK
jgi:large conductance mechanosensitive channel